MKVLFIGGNGNISWYCTQFAIEKGFEVYELNRGQTLKTRRDIQPEVIKLTADIRNREDVKKAIKDLDFDCVCDFICFNEEHAKDNIEIFKDKTKQYIYISSEAVYKRKTEYLPFKENCEQYNEDEVCKYVSGKIKAEQVFKNAYEKENFPVTIVRPGYTYDVIIPTSIGQNCFTAANRLLNGDPLLIAGEGNNLATFTHSSDFARAFVELIGNKKAIGEDFHITSDEWLTWVEESEILLDTLNIKDKRIIHIPYDEALKLTFFEPDIMYQKMWHSIYDNSKIKKFVPSWNYKVKFKDGIKQTLNWLFEKDVRRRINSNFNETFDELYKKYKRG